MAEFTPITSQEQLDAIIAKRLKDVKDQTQEVEKLKAQVEAKDKQLTNLQKTHSLEWELAKRGLDTPVTAAKVESLKRLIDLDSETDPAEQLESLSKRIPELFQVPQGAGSGYFSRKPALDRASALTEEDIAAMSPEEMAKPGIMAKIDKFMAGQR
jgi:dsDNA-specific endonuclease/ATPase MutS2